MLQDKFVKEYAKGILEDSYKVADRLFHAEYIMKMAESEIWDRLEELEVVLKPGTYNSHKANFDLNNYRCADIEWDDYDMSLELMDCEDGFTLTSAQVDSIKDMGFKIIFVNYKNGPHLYGNKTAAMNAMPVIKENT